MGGLGTAVPMWDRTPDPENAWCLLLVSPTLWAKASFTAVLALLF